MVPESITLSLRTPFLRLDLLEDFLLLDFVSELIQILRYLHSQCHHSISTSQRDTYFALFPSDTLVSLELKSFFLRLPSPLLCQLSPKFLQLLLLFLFRQGLDLAGRLNSKPLVLL